MNANERKRTVMNDSCLKSLNWDTEGSEQGVIHAQGAGVFYTIMSSSMPITVYWHDQMEGTHGSNEACKSVDDAIEFVEGTHYPHKMARFVSQDSITDIAAWFKAAKPEPTTEDLCVQIGCHLEETAELLQALGVHNQMATDDLPHLADAFKRKDSRCLTLVSRLTNEQRIEVVDACCDTTVTSVGVMQLLGGVDVLGALREVIRSNNSKMVNGRFEFDENGKIKKPASFSEPNLEPYLNKE